ncbi:MAG: SHOCT domain-containing protein [bacterium]|nr:SHOCT domain-containing protein [bacterium]
MMYGLYSNNWGYNMMNGTIGGIMMIFFWILLVIFIVWVVKEISGKNSHTNSASNSRAIDILKERYAKGEIDKQEFEAKKKDLS